MTDDQKVSYQGGDQFNYDTTANGAANSGYFNEPTNPAEDDPDGHYLSEKIIEQHKARVYYGDRPGFAEASLLIGLIVYGALLLYTGPMNWNNDCPQPLSIWCVVAGLLIMIVAMTYFYVRNRYLWDRKRDRPQTVVLMFVGGLLFVLFIWGTIGIVWTFQSLSCQDTERGAVVFYWCLITACFFMLMWAAGLFFLAYLMLTKGTGKVWKAIVGLGNLLNKPYSRVPLYILMIIIGIVLIALSGRSWDEACDQPLSAWILALGILLVVGGIVCIGIDCVIWFAREGGPKNAVKNAFKKNEPAGKDEDDSDGSDADEDAYFTKARKSPKSRHLMKLLLVVYLFFVLIFVAGVAGIFFIVMTEAPCAGRVVFLDAKIAFILWLILMALILLYLIMLYGVLPTLLAHKKEIKSGKSFSLADLIPFFFALVMILFAIIAIFMGGLHAKTACDRPFSQFHTGFGVTLFVICILVMLLNQWGQHPHRSQDVGHNLFRVLFGVMVIWFVILGMWGIYWYSDTNCPNKVTDFFAAELAIWCLIVAVSSFYVAWSSYTKIKKRKQLKAEGVTDPDMDEGIFDAADENGHPHMSTMKELQAAFWLFITCFCLAGLYGTGLVWDITCDEPLKEFMLVFMLVGAVASTLMIIRLFIVIFHGHTKKLLIRLVCDIPALSLLMFNCVWGITGMVWFFKADACVDTNQTIYAWTFFALMVFLFVLGIMILGGFWHLSNHSGRITKMTEGELDEEAIALKNLKNNKYIRVAVVMWACLAAVMWSLLCIVVSSIDLDTACDRSSMTLYVMVFGVTLLVMATVTMILKLYEILRPDTKSKVKPLKIVLMIMSVLVVIGSIYGMFMVWITKDCHSKIPDSFNIAMICVIFTFLFIFLVACTVFLRALTPQEEVVEDWDPSHTEASHKKKLHWDFRRNAFDSTLPMGLAEYINYTWLGGFMIFCTAYAAESWHKTTTCDEPLREWLVAAGVMGMIYLFMLFLKDCQATLAAPSSEKQFTGPIVRGLLVFALLVWGICGVVFFFKTADCKDKAPGLYNAMFAMLCVFLVFLIYVAMMLARFCMEPSKIFKNTTFRKSNRSEAKVPMN